MYVRVCSNISGQIYQSMVYAKVNTGWYEQYIVYNQSKCTFELVDYLDKTSTPAKPFIHVIQTSIDGFKEYKVELSINVQSKKPKILNKGLSVAFFVVERSETKKNATVRYSDSLLLRRPLPIPGRRKTTRIACIDSEPIVVDKNISENDALNFFPSTSMSGYTVDFFLLQRCEKTFHSRIVKATSRTA